MGINFNGGTMLGTFNAQATFMQNAMTMRPLAPMPMSVRTVNSAYSPTPGRLAQLASKPARVATGPFASVRDALPVGRRAIDHARVGARAAIGIGTATFLSGCDDWESWTTPKGIHGYSDADCVFALCVMYGIGPFVGLCCLVGYIIREAKKQKITELHGNNGIDGVKDAIKEGHSPYFLGEHVFGRKSVIKAMVELLVDEKAALSESDGDRACRALAFKDVGKALETNAFLSTKLDWDLTDITLKPARAHLRQMMLDEGFIEDVSSKGLGVEQKQG